MIKILVGTKRFITTEKIVRNTIFHFVVLIYFLKGKGCMRHSTWWSEDSFQESVLSFHHVGPGNRTSVVRLGGNRLHH